MVFSNQNSKTIIITSMSYKNKKTCVAGFEKDTKKWCRIITNDEESKGAVDYKIDLQDSKGFYPQVGDCIKFWYDNNYHAQDFQPENHLIDHTIKVEILEDLNLDYILNNSPLITPNEPIFLNNNNYLTADEMRKLKSSLLAAKVKNFKFYKNQNNKCKCNFVYNNEQYENFSLTMDMDNNTRNFKLKKDVIYDNAYVVVSIGTPINCSQSLRYYKFVATVIPFVFIQSSNT